MSKKNVEEQFEVEIGYPLGENLESIAVDTDTEYYP